MVLHGDQIRHPGSPGWVLGIALTNIHVRHKRAHCYRNLRQRSLSCDSRNNTIQATGPMASIGQTQLGANILRAEFLSPREKIRVGCVLECIHHLSDYQAGSSRNRGGQVQNSHQQFSEARWTGPGMMKERSGHKSDTFSTKRQPTCRRDSNHHVKQSREDIDRILAIEGKTCHGYI